MDINSGRLQRRKLQHVVLTTLTFLCLLLFPSYTESYRGKNLQPTTGYMQLLKAFNAAIQDVVVSQEWSLFMAGNIYDLDIPEWERCADDCITNFQKWPTPEELEYKGAMWKVLAFGELVVGYVPSAKRNAPFFAPIGASGSDDCLEPWLFKKAVEKIEQHYGVKVKPTYKAYNMESPEKSEEAMLADLKEQKIYMALNFLSQSDAKRNSGMFTCSYMGSDAGFFFPSIPDSYISAEDKKFWETSPTRSGMKIPKGSSVLTMLHNLQNIETKNFTITQNGKTETVKLDVSIITVSGAPILDVINKYAIYSPKVVADYEELCEEMERSPSQKNTYFYRVFVGNALLLGSCHSKTNLGLSMKRGYYEDNSKERYGFMVALDKSKYSAGNSQLLQSINRGIYDLLSTKPFPNLQSGCATFSFKTELNVTDDNERYFYENPALKDYIVESTVDATEDTGTVKICSYLSYLWFKSFYPQLLDNMEEVGSTRVVDDVPSFPPIVRNFDVTPWMSLDYPSSNDFVAGGTLERAVSTGNMLVGMGEPWYYVNTQNPDGFYTLIVKELLDIIGKNYGRKIIPSFVLNRNDPGKQALVTVASYRMQPEDFDAGFMSDADMSLAPLDPARAAIAEFVQFSNPLFDFVPFCIAKGEPEVAPNQIYCRGNSLITDVSGSNCTSGLTTEDIDSPYRIFSIGKDQIGVKDSDIGIFGWIKACMDSYLANATDQLENCWNNFKIERLNVPVQKIYIPVRYDWEDIIVAPKYDDLAWTLAQCGMIISALGCVGGIVLLMLHLTGMITPAEREEENEFAVYSRSSAAKPLTTAAPLTKGGANATNGRSPLATGASLLMS